jgi:hypothetical protein
LISDEKSDMEDPTPDVTTKPCSPLTERVPPLVMSFDDEMFPTEVIPPAPAAISYEPINPVAAKSPVTRTLPVDAIPPVEARTPPTRRLVFSTLLGVAGMEDS